MRIDGMYLLTQDQMADLITIHNLRHRGKTFLVSRKWYNRMVEYDFVNDCDFNIVVSQFKFHPQNPMLLL